MDAKEFVKAVAYMRQLQKDYFKGRSPLLLQEAKQAEKKVDQMIADMKEPELFKE